MKYEVIDPTGGQGAEIGPYINPENETESLTIPFGFTVGVFTVAGKIKLEDTIENSYVSGYVIPGGNFRLDKNNQIFETSIEVLKIRIGFDLDRKQVYWQLAERSVRGFPPKFYWKWHGRNVIFDW